MILELEPDDHTSATLLKLLFGAQLMTIKAVCLAQEDSCFKVMKFSLVNEQKSTMDNIQ